MKRLQVDVMVTTAGGIEEDFIKCLAPTYKGDFALPGAQLRAKGLNRIGNLLAPNDNYCKFEDWIQPIFDQMMKEQIQDVYSLKFFSYFSTFYTYLPCAHHTQTHQIFSSEVKPHKLIYFSLWFLRK